MGEHKKKNSATEVFIVSANTRKGSNPVKRYGESTSNLGKKKGGGCGENRLEMQQNAVCRKENRTDGAFLFIQLYNKIRNPKPHRFQYLLANYCNTLKANDCLSVLPSGMNDSYVI
jgi:hypothetical protein